MASDRPRPVWVAGRVRANRPVSAGLLKLDLELPRAAEFQPGQFAMLNFPAPSTLTFGRPLSILAADGPVVSFLYRVVGDGTVRLAAARPGEELTYFGPLGCPFPPPGDDAPTLLLAGGVGLPPLLAWRARHGRPEDVACFGARAGADVPWDLLEPTWRIAVDVAGAAPAGREVFVGTVVGLGGAALASRAAEPWRVLACGPLPMLRAVAELAAARGWPCLVSVEERMGCGYGVCRGCVLPDRDGGHLTACQDGPVLAAETIDWERFGAAPAQGAGEPGARDRGEEVRP